MATTAAPWSIPYAGPNDAPNVPYWEQRLAERVHALVAALDVAQPRQVNAANVDVTSSSFAKLEQFSSVALTAGRWYRVRYQAQSMSTATNMPIAFQLVSSATTDSTAAGTSLDDQKTFWTAPVVASALTMDVWFSWQAATTATVNLKLIAAKAGATTVSLSKRSIWLEDLGA
jgi:hypothetical protein